LKLELNGKAIEVEAGTTVGQLVDRLSPDRSRVAVERNRAIVPRATLDEVQVEEGDAIEVVTLVGGG
jgi:thiamine biosynthesis protein ThiS